MSDSARIISILKRRAEQARQHRGDRAEFGAQPVGGRHLQHSRARLAAFALALKGACEALCIHAGVFQHGMERTDPGKDGL